jgi:hypothetical protein
MPVGSVGNCPSSPPPFDDSKTPGSDAVSDMRQALLLARGELNKFGRAEDYGNLLVPTRWPFQPFIGRFS